MHGTAARVWVLQGARTGDNAQALELAQRLSLGFETRPLTYNLLHNLPNILLGESLASVGGGRASLRAPWPDLVIATGKRAAPVARWIKRQSGGRTKLVHLGRPRAPLDQFDLVITTPQYGLPPTENTVVAPLPFASPRPADPAVVEKWRGEWQYLPRPWLAVLVGAGRYPLRLGPSEARAMKRVLERDIEKSGGSVIVAGSPRTDTRVLDELSHFQSPFLSMAWKKDDGGAFQALLSLADRFAVTSDSVSMTSEALSSGKPALAFLLPQSPWRIGWLARSGWTAALARSGIIQPPRDISRMIGDLVEAGYLGVLGEREPSRPFVRADNHVIERIRQLLPRA
jgi:mitochondrial fission protein ELM1